MPKSEIFFQSLARLSADDRWPQTLYVQSHLHQQVTMPLGTAWGTTLHITCDYLKDAFDTIIEPMQVEGYRIEVEGCILFSHNGCGYSLLDFNGSPIHVSQFCLNPLS